jgi:hypothetical protein
MEATPGKIWGCFQHGEKAVEGGLRLRAASDSQQTFDRSLGSQIILDPANTHKAW